MSTLKELRTENGLTQQQAAKIVGISLRSYKTYENDVEKQRTRKYMYYVEEIVKKCRVDESHGILRFDDIKANSKSVFEKYGVEFAYLFGSYAKGNAGETSDVDILVCTDISGLQFYGLVEDLRQTLHKNVDVLDIKQLNNNLELTTEILRDGIKIYG